MMFVLSWVFIISGVSSGAPPQFVVDYFSRQNIYSIDIFMCQNEESLLFMKYVQSKERFIGSYVHALKPEIPLRLGNLNYKHGLFLDSSCESSKKLFENGMQDNITSGTSMLIWGNSLENISSIINGIDCLNFDSSFMAIPNLKDKISVYKLCDGSPVFPLEKIPEDFEVNDVERKVDLTGLVLHGAVYVIDNPMSRKDEGDPNCLSPLTNFIINIHSYLQDLYRFEWKLIYINDKLNKSSELVINDLDFIITSEKLIPEAFHESSTLPPIKYIRQCFLFLHPPIYEFPAFYTRPLSVDLWVGLAVVLVGTAVLYYITCWFDIQDIDYNEKSFSGCLIMPLGILANQGLAVLVERPSKRVIQFTLLEFDIIVWCFYSAVMLNYLLHPAFVILKNTEDLLYEGFTFGKENIIFNNVTEIENADESNRVINNLIEFSGKFDLIDGVNEMMNSKFVFFTIDTNVHRMAPILFRKDQICSLVTIPLHKNYGISMYLKERTRLKDLFQRGILLLKEFGIVDREDQEVNQIQLKCTGSVEFVQIGLQPTLFACKIYSIGLLFSLFLLLVELLCFKSLKLKLDYI